MHFEVKVFYVIVKITKYLNQNCPTLQLEIVLVKFVSAVAVLTTVS